MAEQNFARLWLSFGQAQLPRQGTNNGGTEEHTSMSRTKGMQRKQEKRRAKFSALDMSR